MTLSEAHVADLLTTHCTRFSHHKGARWGWPLFTIGDHHDPALFIYELRPGVWEVQHNIYGSVVVLEREELFGVLAAWHMGIINTDAAKASLIAAVALAKRLQMEIEVLYNEHLELSVVEVLMQEEDKERFLLVSNLPPCKSMWDLERALVGIQDAVST